MINLESNIYCKFLQCIGVKSMVVEISRNQAVVSNYFASKLPSNIRLSGIAYSNREDNVGLINGAIGNVSLPVHPKMYKRLVEIGTPEGGFADGIVKYEETAGNPETQAAFKNILTQQGFDASDLEVLITDGSSMAMEVAMLGICGEPGADDKPLLMFDPSYTNFNSVAKRIGRKTITVKRTLNENGKFSFLDIKEIEETILSERPNGILIIPYDNPTGQMYDKKTMVEIAKLCVKHNLWLLSDEAYRGLFYDKNREILSIWGITDKEVPGIEGRRISLETSSKVWNACGLRIGALITDSEIFLEKAVADYTTNLCANALGQHVFGALAHDSREEILDWMENIQDHYRNISYNMYKNFKALNKNLIVSDPDSSIYTVIDVRNVVKPGFDSLDFVLYAAMHGKVNVNGEELTLLVVPLTGFYNEVPGEPNPGLTQLRISFCEPEDQLEKIPYVFVELLKQYENQRV